MTVLRNLRYFITLVILSFTLVQVSVINADKYSVDGDMVYIEDERALIQVSPKDITGDRIDLSFISKQYSGDLDVVFGFDSNSCYPKKVELYGTWENSRKIPDKYFDSSDYMYNYTQNYVNLYSKYYYDENNDEYIYTNNWNLEHSYYYDRASLSDRIIYCDKSYYKTINSPKIITANYDGFDNWYYGRINVNSGQLYKLRIYFDIIPDLNGVQNKYGIGLKPGDLTIKDALQQNKFYYLDPWYDTDWNNRINFTIASASGASTNYAIRLKIYNTTGTNTGNTVYLGSNVQTDWGDLRFTDDDGTTLLDYWIQETFSTYAWVWVEENDNLNSTNQNACLYYNASTTKTTTSDISATFDLGDDFDDNDISDWTLMGDTGQMTVSNGVITIDDPVSSTGIRKAMSTDSVRVITRLNISKSGYCTPRLWDSGLIHTDSIGYGYYHTGEAIGWLDGASWQTSASATYGDWHTITYVVEDDSVDDADMYVDYGSRDDIDRRTTNVWEYIVLNVGQTNDPIGEFDYVCADAYVNPEPSVSSWGTVENVPVTPPTTVTVGLALLGAIIAFIIGLMGVKS